MASLRIDTVQFGILSSSDADQDHCKLFAST